MRARGPAESPASSGRSYIALSVVVIVLWRDPVIVDEGHFTKVGSVLFIALPLALVVFLRATVAVRDGSGAAVWVVRIVGWSVAIAGVAAAAPAVVALFERTPHELCLLTVVPERQVAVCVPWVDTALEIGRGAVLVAMILGVLGLTGAFGAATRYLGALTSGRRART